MGIGRKEVEKRLLLYRKCGTCGKGIATQANTPWARVIKDENGKWHNTYFCSGECMKKSYKHIGWYDGKAEERRKEREAKRDISAKNRKYYENHKEQEKARARARYWVNPEAARAANRYSKEKRRLLAKQD